MEHAEARMGTILAFPTPQTKRFSTFGALERGELFLQLETGMSYVKWPDPISGRDVGWSLARDREGELRLDRSTPVTVFPRAEDCRALGARVHNLHEVHAIQQLRV